MGFEHETHKMYKNENAYIPSNASVCISDPFNSQSCEKRLLASLCLCVCPSVDPSPWNNTAPTGRIFMKFDIWGFF
jgi:hypothetical protein